MGRSQLFAMLLLFCGSSHIVQAQAIAPSPASGLSQQQLLEAGKQIYLHGLMPGGGEIRAQARGDVPLSGSQYACANCHRRSGIGSSEGGDLVPPIIGTSLFAPLVAELHDQYPIGGMHNVIRPAYTVKSLGRALREGVDPAGRMLSPLMPRFVLSDDEVLALSTYLASLTVALPPGIDDKVIHFATIATPGNDAERDAMLDVYHRFFRDKNANTRDELGRAAHAPYHKKWQYAAYRQWQLHVWQLSGPQASWPAQLQRLYAEQPVFAVLGGVGSGDWQVVHRFCEEQELPCLLPNIAAPPAQADQDFYSIYYSRGVELEALALADTLTHSDRKPLQVIEVLRDSPEDHIAAATLHQALQAEGSPALTDIVLDEDQAPSAGFWSRLAAEHPDAVWVLWLAEKDLKELKDDARPAAIYLSATLQRDLVALEQHPLHARFTLLSPYQPPDKGENSFRYLDWARLRKVPISHLHIQSSAFLAATLAGESLSHMRGNFSREYFIERIEHMMDNMINPSLYPRVSLAPGQRFAAKGCYVWSMGKEFDTAKWVVP